MIEGKTIEKTKKCVMTKPSPHYYFVEDMALSTAQKWEDDGVQISSVYDEHAIYSDDEGRVNSNKLQEYLKDDGITRNDA